MTRRLAGTVASCLALLAGLWLILSPFALGLQRSGRDWTHQTITDVWSGIGLGVVGLISMIIFAAALAQNLVERGLIERRTQRRPAEPAPAQPEAGAFQAAQPGPAPAPAGDLDKLLAPLVQALTKDLARDQGPGPTATDQPGNDFATTARATGNGQPEPAQASRYANFDDPKEPLR